MLKEGFTKNLAKFIQKQLGSDIFEIEESIPYTLESYDECVKESRPHFKEYKLVPIKKYLENLEDYDEIFLGFPIWFGTYPMPVATFFNKYNLKNKKVNLFVTHGGGGKSRSLEDVKNKLLPNCDIDDKPLVIFGDTNLLFDNEKTILN